MSFDYFVLIRLAFMVAENNPYLHDMIDVVTLFKHWPVSGREIKSKSVTAAAVRLNDHLKMTLKNVDKVVTTIRNMLIHILEYAVGIIIATSFLLPLNKYTRN